MYAWHSSPFPLTKENNANRIHKQTAPFIPNLYTKTLQNSEFSVSLGQSLEIFSGAFFLSAIVED